MNKPFLFLISLFIFTNICSGQSPTTKPVNVATQNDTAKYSFSAGFYLTIPDVSKTQGFQLINSNDFYYIGTKYGVTLRNIDTVYKEFDRNFKLYVLTFKFDTVGTKELLNFTMKYQGQQIGLLIDNKLFSVATIPSPIESGVMTLAGKFTEPEIDRLKIEIEKAVTKIKSQRGTSKRNFKPVQTKGSH